MSKALSMLVQTDCNMDFVCQPTREEFETWRRVTDTATAMGVEFEPYAWPGGYPIFHITKDGGTLCTKCANENISLTADDTETADPQWSIADSEINYEDPDLYCDHCSERIESAYAEEEKP